MGRRIVSPEEQLRQIARKLLEVASDPDRHLYYSKEDFRAAVEALAGMVQHLLEGELRPIEVEPTEDS